jgi:hypothetical protein
MLVYMRHLGQFETSTGDNECMYWRMHAHKVVSKASTEDTVCAQSKAGTEDAVFAHVCSQYESKCAQRKKPAEKEEAREASYSHALKKEKGLGLRA